MNKGLSQFAENGLKWLSILDADESKRRVWNEQVLVPVEGQSLDALFALAAEQDETKPCTCGQPDCPFADTGPEGSDNTITGGLRAAGYADFGPM